jgi:hypothetical protein
MEIILLCRYCNALLWGSSDSCSAPLWCPDILTPLPALGVDFTIVPGKGPKIINPIKSKEDVAALKPMHDVAQQVPFLGPILQVSQFTHDVNVAM